MQHHVVGQFPTFLSIIVHSFSFILLGLLDPEEEDTAILPHLAMTFPAMQHQTLFHSLHFQCFVQDKN
jgi:hypothetical protein